MKILCNVCVGNRLQANLPMNSKRKHVKSTLALCKHPNNDDYFIILFTAQNKTGTRYPIRGNIKQVLTRFINEGKCTIQFNQPEHDLYVQGDTIQLKGFLHLFRRALNNEISAKEMSFSSMSVMPVKQKDVAPTKLIITKRSEYPSKGFAKTLEIIFINGINRCGLDKGILQLPKLKVLDLSDNLIEFLPEELNKLPNLRELNLSRNKLGYGGLKQWNWIGGLLSKTLLSLDLSFNELSFVPEQLVKLHKITTLRLNDNNLKSLPSGIGNLRNLKIFSAANNALTVLPGSVEKLKLQSIDLSSNNFTRNPLDGAAMFPKPLPVGSLKEYSGKKVLWARIPYRVGELPVCLVDYLDRAKYCVCGKACFDVFVRHSHNVLLTNIAESIKSAVEDIVYVPVDGYFCSLRCFSSTFYNRNRHPIVR